MKKFLSMLLALSVVFTYTFGAAGSVFAATTDEGDYAYRVAKAQTEAEADLANAYDYLVKSKLQGDSVDGVSIDAVNTKDAIKEAYEDKKASIAAEAEALKALEYDVYTLKDTFSTSYYIDNDGTDTAASIDNSFDAANDVTSTNWDEKKGNLWIVSGDVATKVTNESYDGGATYKTKKTAVKWYDKTDAQGAKTIAELKAVITSAVGVEYTDIADAVYGNPSSASTDYDAYLVKAQFDANKAKALDVVIPVIDLTMYGTDAIADDAYVTVDGEKYYNYNAAATAVVAAYKADIEEMTVPAITSSNKASVKATAVSNCGAINTFLAYLQEQRDDNNIKTGKYEFITTSGAFNTDKNSGVENKIKTAEKVASEDKTATAGKAQSKATLASDIAAFLADSTYLAATKTTTPTKAQYDEFIAAYEKAQTYLIENTANAYTTQVSGAAIGLYDADVVANVDEAEKLIAAAKTLKTVKNADGKIMYDADVIDDNLKVVLVAVYTNCKSSTHYQYKETHLTTSNAYEIEDPTIDYPTDYTKAELKEALVVKAPYTKYNATAYYVYSGKSYYELEAKQVEAAMDDYKAAIDAATTADDLAKALTAFNAALGKVKQVSEINSLYAGKLATTSNAQADVLIAYAATLNAGKTGNALRDLSAYDERSEWATWFKEQGARTDAEITALYEAGVAMLNAIPTAGEAKTAKTEIEAKIAALPTNLTVADKATVKEVYNAYKEYIANFAAAPSNMSTLRLAIYTVGKLEKADVDKLVTELAKIKVLAITDKDQVNAAAAAAKAYNDDLEFGEMYTLAAASLATVDVSSYTNEIRRLELNVVKDAIAALPAAATLADKAQVEAARSAYDAFVTEYEVIGVYDAKLNVGSIDKLTNAEATIAALEKAEAEKAEEAAKAEAEKEALKTTIAVKDSKAKFASSKAYKNSIKLTFNKPAVGVDGYVVYMATKKNGLYKKVATVKTNTYTKKSLKKGTAYYFKVKAYKVVDGKKVYTQTSGKLCKKTTK